MALCSGVQRSMHLLPPLGCNKPKKGFQYGQKSDAFRPLQRSPLLSFSPFHLSKRLEPWLTFDKRLTWKAHLPNAETKARKKLAILRKLASTNWGAHEKNTQDSLPWDSKTHPRVWILSFHDNSQDKSASARQDTELGS